MIYHFAATRSLRNSIDDSPNQKKSEFYHINQRESARKTPRRERNDNDDSFCRMSNSLYIPQALSTSISISINSRNNIHSQRQAPRKKQVKSPNKNASQEQKSKDQSITSLNKARASSMRKTGGLDISQNDLESFRRENFGLKTMTSAFSSDKRRLSFRKASVKPMIYEENEIPYSFEFRKYTPSQMTLKDYLGKIEPDIVPNSSPTFQSRIYHLKKPQTAGVSSRKSPKNKDLDKPKELILSHLYKPSTANNSSNYRMRETSNDKRTAIWKLFSLEDESNISPNIESLDQRCQSQLRNMKKTERFRDIESAYGTRNPHVSKLNQSLITAEKIRQEMYDEMERYGKCVIVKLREERKIQQRAFTPQSIRIYKS